jgi:hypothetical protein
MVIACQLTDAATTLPHASEKNISDMLQLDVNIMA